MSLGEDRSLAAEHERRLDTRYRARFSGAEIRAHLAALSSLSPSRPVAASVRRLGERRLCCTIAAFDHPAEFSLITGMLSSAGVAIASGDAFTWSPADPGTRPEFVRRRIVDVFVGEADDALLDPDATRALEERLCAVLGQLEDGTDAAITRVRRQVNEMAAAAIARMRRAGVSMLRPVDIDLQPGAGDRLRMTVTAQDTPFFLFTFSTALSLQGVAIEEVAIRTEAGRIEDTFEVADAAGRPFDEPGRIDRIRLAVLLTKQFTAFLEGAPDPLAALSRFEQLVGGVLEAPTRGRWVEILTDGRVLADLAHLLGASTFLWEDFVRQQYETLLPMLRPHVAGRRFAQSPSTLGERLDRHLAEAAGPAAFADRLNEFKDREVFLFDLDHLLTPGFDFRELSRCLTALAELIVDRAAAFVHAGLAARFGHPRTVAGIPARFAVLGLGKMGGAALGYASDIELLFVYSDAGSTAGGPEGSLDNAEFFDRMVRGVLRTVRAKREGIFHVDLRLRPHGQAGPLATSLGAFCTYYAPSGAAEAWERLALVRLRAVAGDRDLGARLERLRDELVYAGPALDLASLRRLRERQLEEKSRSGSRNAKFSPGSLVDLEYAVQVLQIEHGRTSVRLRTPRIHEALDELAAASVLATEEARGLVASYRFFRLLVNGLRMLRGSARDLFLPPAGDDELLHLARRLGYGRGDGIVTGIEPDRALTIDFETHTAFVRAFLERRFGGDAVPGTPVAGVADIVLSDAVPDAIARTALAARGFQDPARALVNLSNMARSGEEGLHAGERIARRAAFARLAVLACDLLGRMPDPDMALNNWERFLESAGGSRGRLEEMLAQPMRLEILLSLCSTSQFLADTLVNEPGLLDWLGAPGGIETGCRADGLARELGALSAARADDRPGWLEELRRVRRRELLRICARDVCLGIPTRRVMEELSGLAEALLRAAFERGSADEGPAPAGLCVLALGKLGGRELNYSSDVDLLVLCDPDPDPAGAERAVRIARRLRGDLSQRTSGGHASRVDFRLRPWGVSGELVSAVPALLEYYARSAGLWELQAMLQARAVAGDTSAGERFLAGIRALLARPRDRCEVMSCLARPRPPIPPGEIDIKQGPGGIRDVEFLVQGLRLLHAPGHPALREGGTLASLEVLTEEGIVYADEARAIGDDYLFLRRVEHFLQVYEDRQVHRLPRDPVELRALARRMLGKGATADTLLADLAERSNRVRLRFERFVN
jgi:glutamate-ammonia-ligase adenylyltransferase